MSINKSKGGRKKNEVTDEIKEEAKEILDLAFKDVGCIKSKVTYNNVAKFNIHIANNPNYIRKNGQYFNFLGDRFWTKSYNDVPYHGRKIIDQLKSTKNVKVGGAAFDINNKDIESLVDRYSNKPEELKKRLINLFSKDRNEILSLRDRNNKLTERLNHKDKTIKEFEKGFATIFWNSTSAYNSLDDLLTLERPEDGQVNDELLNMFRNDKEKIMKLLNENSKINNVQLIQPSCEEQDSEGKTKSDKNVVSIKEKMKVVGISSSEEDGL